MSINEWAPFDPLGRGIEADFAEWDPRRFGTYGEQLVNNQTKIVYVSPDGQRVYNLAGSWKGNRGVVLAPNLKGNTGSPFEQLYSSGAWMLGERPERTDWGKRVIQCGVIIAPHVNAVSKLRYKDTAFALRMLEEQWQQDWPEDQSLPAGFWGEFTRYSGWRWTRVRHGAANEDTVEYDPHAHGNNLSTQSMTLHAPFPFFTKRALTKEWRNDEANAFVNGKNHGILRLPNRGDYAQYPKFIIEGDGDVTIQDGIADRMVALPKIRRKDGMVLVDTDPSKRTLTSEHDPIDTPLYKLIRNSEILDWLLGDITQADAGLPIGRRMPGGVGFSQAGKIPAESMAVIKVTHTNPRGKITMIMPQWYRRGVA